MMSSLRSVEAKLPPGFRFHPRDEELICDYLMKWVVGCAHPPLPSLIQVDLNKCEPWDIPETACVGGKDWYFYSQRDRKYSTGLRTNRATVSGYWKATGKDRPVIRKGNLVGMRKTLVFYQGRAPKGKKTDWVMHEYRLEGTQGPGPKTTSSVQEDWVLCRVFFKNTSEIPAKLEETTPSSPSIPMIEPYNNNNNDNNNNNITILDHQTQAAGCSNDHHLYNEQVPCFSILNTNQTSPTFSLLTVHMDFPDVINTPHCHLGTNNYSNDYSPSLINNHDYPCSPSTSCDEKALRDVLNHLTKMESANDNSPSFGEGSSDSYLSEVGLCSMWNQYS